MRKWPARAGAERVAGQHRHALLFEEAAGERQGLEAGRPDVEQGEHAAFRRREPAGGGVRQQGGKVRGAMGDRSRAGRNTSGRSRSSRRQHALLQERRPAEQHAQHEV